MAGPDPSKLAKLIAVGRDLQEKMSAVLDELDEVIGGRASIGDLMKQARIDFAAAWATRYGGQAYAWSMARDMGNLKRLIKLVGCAEFTNRCGRYIQNSDPFVMKTRHSFGLFISTFNQYATEAPTGELTLGGDDTAPVGCRHQPPCVSDVAHTQRMRNELRG